MSLSLEDDQKTPQAEQPPACPFPDKSAGACPVQTSIQEVDPELLRESLDDRMVYLKDFLRFGKEDQEIINKVAPLVNELIPEVVDKLYAKLFEFDITKQVFLERNQGFDGPLPATLDDLTLDSPQLIYRKIFMKNWARRVLTSDYSSGKTWAWMDKVGIMHTGVKAFKHRSDVPPLVVPYRDCALSLGWVLIALQTAILELPNETLGISDKVNAVTALNKVIWIQNDLFARHYINE
ncbi:Protoglobin-domain-containing protein [Mycena floridula]|nr:Protoglobin-domain-containing protein [Mycena floridula]